MSDLEDTKPDTHGPAEDENVTDPADSGQKQQIPDGERQQGDQDLGADSKSAPDSQGMK